MTNNKKENKMCLYFDVFKKTLMQDFVGKKIEKLYIDPEYNNGDGGLVIQFEDNKKIILFDDNRQCCESRYIHSNDNLSWHEGSNFKGIQIKNIRDKRDECDFKHETQFIHVLTETDTLVIETHNVHEGHYGGFNLKIDTNDW
jgi:hypothetical protein